MVNYKDANFKCQWIVQVERRIRQELPSSILQGQLNSERAATAGRAFDGKCSAMRFDDPTRDRQTQARAAKGAGTSFIDAIKAVEDALLIFGWNADAGVSYHDLSRAVS